MFHIQLLRTLSALASAGFNPRVYLLSIALGQRATDDRDAKQPSRIVRP